MLPNFNAWHEVPKDATIPAGTPYWRYSSEEDGGRYYGRGVGSDLDPSERFPRVDYYTEEPILSPEQEAQEKRARAMYYAVPGSDTWEHLDWYTQEAWLGLAARYVEK